MSIVDNKLDEKYVEKLYEIFEKNKWEIEELGTSSVFDRFCDRLAELNDDAEQNLVLELTERFLWIKSNKYEDLLITTFNKAIESGNMNIGSNKVYICGTSYSDEFELKSSDQLLYLCQSICLRTFDFFENTQIRICSTLKVIKEHKDDISELIVIDDYIGSGETVLTALEVLKKFVLEDCITIISLVAQEDGIKNIKRENKKVKIYSGIVCNKGITDYYDTEKIDEKLALMKSISRKIKAQSGMKYGYDETEGLVALVKTPNNTFPVYWKESGKSKAPFPRKGNIRML